MYLSKILFVLIALLPIWLVKPDTQNSNTLEIDSLNIASPFYISYSKSMLKYGVIIDGNSLEGNNWIVYGHRFSRFGKDTAFFDLNHIEIGETIRLILKGVEYRFRVSEVIQVERDQLWSIAQGSERTLTIITCTPVFYPINRLVVIAQLI